MTDRLERDPLGELPVPADAYYGIQTQRAVENFPISGLHAPADLVTATILIKKAAAEANIGLGRLDRRVGEAIVRAADEILSGRLRDQFVVDVYQAGAGTSHNMNANEVLANRAAELLGEPRGRYTVVHPNDHVNMGQSTNDTFPAATRLALLLRLGDLLRAARDLAGAFGRKSVAFRDVLKVGRTHLQDAVPITLGQEFSGYEACLERAAELLGEPRGRYTVVHPNDHVNMGQSTNDTFPAATRLALLLRLGDLLLAARGLAAAFGRKSAAFRNVLKVGRTHLQDAVPITLGQEFGGYQACRRRKRVVGRLAHVHVVVRMDHAVSAAWLAEQLSGAVGQHLVGRPHDGVANAPVQPTERNVRLGRGLLDHDGCGDEIGRGPKAADGEILDRALRLDAVVGVGGDGEFTQRVALCAV